MKIKISLFALAFIFSSAFVSEDLVTMQPSNDIDAEKLYKSNCRLCHGAKGGLGINGATDLRKSTLKKSEIADVIANGRGVMTPFKDILDEEQIKALSKFVLKLQK